MDPEQEDDLTRDVSRLGALAGPAFLSIEVVAYIVLGLLLAVAALVGVVDAGFSLASAAMSFRDSEGLVVFMDKLLFVLMVVEILHTVRVSFRAGMLAAEPFLIVGLIASIRRVLVITLESSRASQSGVLSPSSQAVLNASMLELAVLAGLILIMVISIFMLRRSEQRPRSRS
jgi:uncharacterized membrane protein (DUF373 family)